MANTVDINLNGSLYQIMLVLNCYFKFESNDDPLILKNNYSIKLMQIILLEFIYFDNLCTQRVEEIEKCIK